MVYKYRRPIARVIDWGFRNCAPAKRRPMSRFIGWGFRYCAPAKRRPL